MVANSPVNDVDILGLESREQKEETRRNRNIANLNGRVKNQEERISQAIRNPIIARQGGKWYFQHWLQERGSQSYNGS